MRNSVHLGSTAVELRRSAARKRREAAAVKPVGPARALDAESDRARRGIFLDHEHG